MLRSVLRRLAGTSCLSLLAVCLVGACEQRSDTQPSAAPPPAPKAVHVEPPPAAKPEPPIADAASPTTEVPATRAATPLQRPDAGSQVARKRRAVRVIHPQPGQTGCVEMYGECTRDEPPVCTSSALALDCGERGRLPNTGEPLHCICP